MTSCRAGPPTARNIFALHARPTRAANWSSAALSPIRQTAPFSSSVRLIAFVEDFARHDPYVVNGLVTQWEARPWAIVIGG